jgi:TolA-binding protein
MNTKNLWATLLLFTLILTACTSSKSSTPTVGAAGKLPTQTKLILGTIKLEETNNVVTAEQAKNLLPMFYVLQELNDSGSAAQEEIDGLVNQIQQTLTEAQLQTIDDMSLSMQDVGTLTQGRSRGTSSSDASSTTGAGGGGMGGPPDMGGGPGGEMPSAGTTSAGSDTSAAPVMDTSAPSALFDAVIEILQKKVQL